METEEEFGCSGCLGSLIGIGMGIYGWNADLSWQSSFSWVAFGIIVFLVGCIWSFIGAAVETGKAGAKAVAELVEYVIDQLIDLFSIKQNVKSHCPNAFKIMIQQKKRNAVNVGIFNKNNTLIQRQTIESDYGVADEVKTGSVIYV